MELNGDKYKIPGELSEDFDYATSLVESAEYVKARGLLGELLERSPDHPRILNAIGTTYLNERSFGKAEQNYQLALNIAPDFYPLYYNLSMVYSITGCSNEAAKFADLAMDNLPKSALSWNIIGIYHTFLGNYECALDYFLTAYYMDDTLLEAAYNIACVHAVLGQTNLALSYLERSLKSPKLIAQAEIDPDLRSIKHTTDFKALIIIAEERIKMEEEKIIAEQPGSNGYEGDIAKFKIILSFAEIEIEGSESLIRDLFYRIETLIRSVDEIAEETETTV